MTYNQIIGNKAEESVVLLLRQQKYSILVCNYTCRYGEIDIIARSKNLIIFVEVKMRMHALFDISAVITISKQQKIIKSAQHFLVTHGLYQSAMHRFDVALVQGADYQICYIPDAFQIVTS